MVPVLISILLQNLLEAIVKIYTLPLYVLNLNKGLFDSEHFIIIVLPTKYELVHENVT